MTNGLVEEVALVVAADPIGPARALDYKRSATGHLGHFANREKMRG